MSSKTRTRKTGTTASTTETVRTLRSVPEQAIAAKARTEAEDKLWEALHAAPNSTAADLSATAKIGKSTAQKILVKWATEGSVTRTAGIAEGGRRAADLWAIIDVDAQEDPSSVDTSGAEDLGTADITQAASVAPAASDSVGPVEQTDAVDDARHPVETESAGLVHAEPVVAEVNQPATHDAATDIDKPTEDDADAPGEKKKTRLAPGGLRGMVEDYLRDHPGEEFGPTAIAKALGGKSSGAVSNALDKLVEDGVAAKTQDTPKRFALVPTEQGTHTAPKD